MSILHRAHPTETKRHKVKEVYQKYKKFEASLFYSGEGKTSVKSSEGDFSINNA